MVDRNWSDDNVNYVVDCDILNPAAQSGAGRDTCGAITGNSLNFGKTGNNVAQVNDALLHGWGVRPNDWQWGINVQQQLRPRVSLDVGYNRRYFHWRTVGTNPGTVTDNLLVGPSESMLPSIRGFPAAAAIRLRSSRSPRRPPIEVRRTTSRSKRTTVPNEPITGTVWT
jgi:hypothetical protein